MKLIDKMLMECQPTPARLHLATMKVMPGGSVMMQCCFVDGYNKEVDRIRSGHSDLQAAHDALVELTGQYPDDLPPVVIVDDIADVMQCAPA